MARTPYIIIELANTHGGDFSYLSSLIDAFEPYQQHYGIKFQPLSPDTLATPDFEWYPVYQTLYFNSEQWREIIHKASTTKDVWIDIFDRYGVTIVKENLSLIHGIKFQSSVLFNDEVIDALSELDLSEHRLILNIAAQSIDQIEERISMIQQLLKPKEILLEIGFQAYPTALGDSGISKIQTIKNKFNLALVFADHLDGKSQDSIYLPIFAFLAGADIIEKHVMLGDRETKYDHFSSQTPEAFEVFTNTLLQYCEAMQAPFINDREIAYLEKTVMIPVVKNNRTPGDLIDLNSDLYFRRSGKKGLTLAQIKEQQSAMKVLSNNKLPNETLTDTDFSKARIGAIVACRMKSSRLKEKALLTIGALSSVEFCLSRALRFQHIDKVVLATSTDPQDAILSDYTYNDQVGFYRGHPEDVMQRYIDVCDEYSLDVVVRITADMPFVDDAICSFLLESHFNTGADYTVGTEAAIGVNLEIFNVSCLKRIKAHFPSAEYSEYMTWYFQNNPEHVRINKVDLPSIFVRPYRLTLDYQEDLELFNHVHRAFENESYTLIDVINYLDKNQEIAAINSHLTLKYKTDQALIDLLNEKTKIIE